MPVPKIDQLRTGLDFSQALEHLKRGRSVRRAAWVSHLRVLPIPGGQYLGIFHPDRSTRTWDPTHTDLLATDWQDC